MQTSPTNHQSKPEKLLRLPEVESLTGLKKSSIYAGMNAVPATFPLSVRLSRRAVGWRQSLVQAWVESRTSAKA